MKNRIELHAKSKYSLDHESTLDIEGLILKCASNGEKGVAIVDNDSITSFLKSENILKRLKLKDFKLIHGVLITVSYKDSLYKMIVLVKKKAGISKLNRLLSPYWTTKSIHLLELIKDKDVFLLGLPLIEDYPEDFLEYVDYVEVDKNVSKKLVNELKKKTLVTYSNRINALEKEEELSKKILYNKFNKNDLIDNRIYQTTDEVMQDINDHEIVIDNPNKIFDMIENFDILDDELLMPDNNDFAIDLLVYIKLNEKYGNNIPDIIQKRVDKELELIREYHYDGYINLYKNIIDKCKEASEDYIIGDYINYLYIAYLLEITHFDPLKMELNYDFFFSNKPNITLYVSDTLSEELLKYVKNDLGINTIRAKGLMRMNDSILIRTIADYEQKKCVKLSEQEKSNINKHLLNYPLSNHAITSSEIIIPKNFDIYSLTPREILSDGINHRRFINIDYHDIKDKFISLNLLSNDKISKLNELKCMIGIKNIPNKDETFLKVKEDILVLDELYEELIDKEIELPIIFNIINEIKSNNLSNTSKELLIANDIKLSKDTNINYVCKGNSLEKYRLEYELLYFKEYFPLEYYYVMLKDCPLYEILDIVKKGYDNVIKKIDDYEDYQYEYKYLNIIRELYESNINFKIEERFLLDKYCFELDKENECLLLLINKDDAEIDKYLDHDISLVGTRPMNGKMPYMGKLLSRLLESNKDITLFGLDGNTNFYLEYLLMEITGIDHKTIRQYLNPCSCYKDNIFDINQESYIYGLKYLLYHDLLIKDYHALDTAIIEGTNTILDKILWMINESDSKVIIIDNPKYIIDDPKYFYEQLQTIAKKKDIHIIIFTTLNKQFESDRKLAISSFEYPRVFSNYCSYITILDDTTLNIIKDSNKNE